MSRRKKEVRWSRFRVVHEVPRGGRGMEPGYVARTARHAALALYSMRPSRAALDDNYGDGDGTWGRRGRYDNDTARRNLWHAQRYGTPMHRAVVLPSGKLSFRPANAATYDARLVEMDLDFRTGRTTMSAW